MTSLTTEDFPYTSRYVMDLLGLDERELLSFVQALGLAPSKDERTGRMIFTHRDLDVLKKASDLKRHGEDMNAIARQLNVKPQASQRPAEGLPSYIAHAATTQPARPAIGKDNITAMVEALSQVKANIVNDLSRLLDDKLSGLDEVVAELIRCKSDNDRLTRERDEAIRAKEQLEYELSRFKPVQFGFYRKT